MSSNKDIILNIKKKRVILLSDLKKIRHLKDVSDWNKVNPLSLIDYHAKFHHYDGGLVEFQGTPAYISKKQISILGQFVKWKFPFVVKVEENS